MDNHVQEVQEQDLQRRRDPLMEIAVRVGVYHAKLKKQGIFGQLADDLTRNLHAVLIDRLPLNMLLPRSQDAADDTPSAT